MKDRFSASEMLAAQRRAETALRTFNESLSVANQSKNRETRKYNLQLARKALIELKKLAIKFPFLHLENLQAVEASIIAVEAETRSLPNNNMADSSIMDVPNKAKSARSLLKEATALKRNKKYTEACDKLREAYFADGAENLMIEDRLRLPMYLQLAGRADEGWGEMNRLNVAYRDGFSQARIAGQMATFLRKEGKYKNAALFAVWTLCKQKRVNIDTHASMVHSADHKPARDVEREALGLPPWPQTMPVTGTTPSGNPIYDIGYPTVYRCLTEDYGPEAIRAALDRDLAKVIAKETISAMVTELSLYLAKPPPYNLGSIKRIVGKHLA